MAREFRADHCGNAQTPGSSNRAPGAKRIGRGWIVTIGTLVAMGIVVGGIGSFTSFWPSDASARAAIGQGPAAQVPYPPSDSASAPDPTNVPKANAAGPQGIGLVADQATAEGQLQVGESLFAEGEYAQAAVAFQTVAEHWPESELVPNALRLANLAVMNLVVEECCPPCPGKGQGTGTVDPGDLDPQHDPPDPCDGGIDPDPNNLIDGNLSRVLDRYPTSPFALDMLYDLAEYQQGPDDCEGGIGTEGEGETYTIREIVERMNELDPTSILTLRASLRLAREVFREEGGEAALALAQSVVASAVQLDDQQLYVESRLAEADVLMWLGRDAAGQQVLDELLAGELSARTRGKALLDRGFAKSRQHDVDGALQDFLELSEGNEFGDDLRAAGLFYAANALHILSLDQQARKLLNRLEEDYPGSKALQVAKRALSRQS